MDSLSVTPTPSQKSILVVDDTPANLRLLAEILSREGFRVRPASNGERALASIQKELPDLILLDIMMPVLDGFTVCRRLKADERTRELPVIFLSALSETFDKVTAFEIGGVDYITKPFQVEEVLARVRTHLSLEDLRRQLRVQNQQLQERNSELDAFAGTVAHDLKNPLATLIGALQLVQKDITQLVPSMPDTLSAHIADVQQMMQISANTARKLATITDELLLLATLRREEIPRIPLRMDEIVARALAQLQSLIEQSKPEIVLPASWPVALSYAPWIEAVWVNYLSNGLRHGIDPIRLELGALQQDPGTLRFWVRDNGPGLSLDVQSQLFAEFASIHQTNPTRSLGHGLGLSIVRRIMTKLGGGYGVESVVPHGSEFYFTLPTF